MTAIKLNKHQLILRDIAAEYLPEYQGKTQELLKNWRHYNVEHIVEDAVCRVGGLVFVDEHHWDNSDYSDTKTATIGWGGVACVNGILSDKGHVPKAGDLRVVVYNPYYTRLDYYFIPKAGWESIREYGAANCDKLRAKYSWEFDRIHKWHQWQVKDFETLAKTPATITKPHEFTPTSNFFKFFDLEDNLLGTDLDDEELVRLERKFLGQISL
jgi:hypothetical protein